MVFIKQCWSWSCSNYTILNKSDYKEIKTYKEHNDYMHFIAPALTDM